jgi:uncharacterized protein YxeA
MRFILASLVVLGVTAFTNKFSWNNLHTKVSRIPLHMVNEAELLEEQVKELVDGVEQFQKDTYNILYGKEVRCTYKLIDRLCKVRYLPSAD